MRKLLLISLLMLAILSSGQAITAHVYVKIIDNAFQSGTVVTVTEHITRDGVSIYNHTGQYYFQDATNPTETQAQFRIRVVTSEKAALDAVIAASKSADATESTNTDVSSFLTGITQ